MCADVTVLPSGIHKWYQARGRGLNKLLIYLDLLARLGLPPGRAIHPIRNADQMNAKPARATAI
jgi:hypothetical protein